MRKESQILEDMRTADSQDQKILAAELNRVRKAAAAQKVADAEVDLADSVIREALAPVRVHGMHSTATDWLEETPSYTEADLKTVANSMRVQANQWYSRLSPGVLADYDELAEQARGEARKVAGAYGEIAGEAADVFMDYVGHLVTIAEGTDAAGVPSAAGDSSNPDLENWKDTPGDSSNEGNTLAPDAPDTSPPGGVPAAPANTDPTTAAKDRHNHDEGWTNYNDEDDHDETDGSEAAQASLISRSARDHLAVEEGQDFPIPGEYDPTQDGEAGTSLPIDVSWERQSEVFPTFVETPKENAAAVSSERAPNVTSSFSIKDTNGNTVAGPFDARGDATQALASQFGSNAEDNGYSVLADGAQSHKGRDEDVNDPEFLGRNVEEAFGNGELPGNKKRAINTEPNPFGSKTYNPSVPTTKGYEEGFYYALLWEPGKPVPAAMSSAAAIGHKYNAEYIEGYQAGVTAGIATLGKATVAAFDAALSHHQVLSGAWEKFKEDEHARAAGDPTTDPEAGAGKAEEDEVINKDSAVAHLPELADESQKDTTPSTPLENGGPGAADVGGVHTPGQSVADYPQATGSGEPSIGGGSEAVDPWFSSGEDRLASFKARVQASIRAEQK